MLSFTASTSSHLSLFTLRSHAAPLPLFLIFPSKTDPTLSSRAWPAAVPLLEERRNDLISPPPLSLWPPRAAHTQIITRRGLIFISLRGHTRAFN